MYQAKIRRQGLDGDFETVNILMQHVQNFGNAERMLVSSFGCEPDNDILAIKICNIAEVIGNEVGSTFFKAKLTQEYKADNGKTRTNRWYWLIGAETAEEATQTAIETLKQGYDGFVLHSLVKSVITEVI